MNLSNVITGLQTVLKSFYVRARRQGRRPRGRRSVTGVRYGVVEESRLENIEEKNEHAAKGFRRTGRGPVGKVRMD